MTQHKHPVNIDRPELSSAEIAKRRDFGAVIAGLSAPVATVPFYKKGWFLTTCGVTAVALMIGGAVWLTSASNQDPIEPIVESVPGETTPDLPEPTPVAPLIQPAFDNLAIAPVLHTVNGNEARTLEFPSGTKVHLPANAFLDELGYQVGGDLTFSFREFHDPADFLVSGIPLEYDSAGSKHRFASAGMVEITASKNGKELFTNPEAPIEVEMVSPKGHGHYNLYFLDKEQANWVSEGEPRVIKYAEAVMEEESRTSAPVAGGVHTRTMVQGNQIIENSVEMLFPDSLSMDIDDPTLQLRDRYQNYRYELDGARKALKDYALREPIEPQLISPEFFNFNIDVDARQFPELANFKDLRFEIRDPDTRFSADFYEVVWQAAELQSNRPEPNFKLFLTKEKRVEEFVVYPVFEESNRNLAMGAFQEKMADYLDQVQVMKADIQALEEKVSTSKNELNEAMDAFALQQKELLAKREAYRQEMQRKAEAARLAYQKKLEEQRSQVNSRNMIFAFQVTNFGIYNCDRVISSPGYVPVNPQFTMNNKPFQPANFHHVDYTNNNLTSYYGAQQFKIHPKEKNVLVVVLEDGRVAYCSPESLQGIRRGANALPLEVSQKKFASISEVRHFLNELAI
ncbi:MAG: hypothetical protein ACFB10_22745 [Salibacteraceae bacterium]